MNKTYLIFRHELLHTLRKTGFIILTLALPVLVLLGIGIFHLVSGATAKPTAQTVGIGYVDQAGGFDRFTNQGNITLVQFTGREEAARALGAGGVEEFFIIPPDFISTGVIDRFTAHRELMPSDTVVGALRNFISSNLMADKLPADAIARIEKPLNLVTTTLTSTGEVAREQGGYENFLIPCIFSLLLALALIFTSNFVLQSLGEEKENRLMEILLSSVSTRQLLIGKVLGRGVAGLVQVLVWIISLPLLLNLASSSIGGFLRTVHIPAGFLILGVVYFILGYALFAVLSAGIAAVSSTVREAQAIAPLFTLCAVAPFWFMSLLMLFPNSPVWVVFSIFPFSAPVMVMLRFGLTDVPAWQLAASISVLAVCIVGGVLLAARLLRTYVLMYGKRPNLGEIVRGLRS